MTKTMLVGLALLLSLPAFGAAKNVSTSGGRFQLVQLSDMRADQYLLDTQTGAIWRSVCLYGDAAAGKCESDFWEKQKVEGITVSKNAILQELKGHDKHVLQRFQSNPCSNPIPDADPGCAVHCVRNYWEQDCEGATR